MVIAKNDPEYQKRLFRACTGLFQALTALESSRSRRSSAYWCLVNACARPWRVRIQGSAASSGHVIHPFDGGEYVGEVNPRFFGGCRGQGCPELEDPWAVIRICSAVSVSEPTKILRHAYTLNAKALMSPESYQQMRPLIRLHLNFCALS